MGMATNGRGAGEVEVMLCLGGEANENNWVFVNVGKRAVCTAREKERKRERGDCHECVE